MKYVLRDPRPLREGWTTDPRFASLERVRVDPLNPQATAEAIGRVTGGRCYLQHLYADNAKKGVEFKSQSHRRSYWREYLKELVKHLVQQSFVSDVLLGIDHPPLGWDPVDEIAHRFKREWIDMFEHWILELRIHLPSGSVVAQFGVESNSPRFYRTPFESMSTTGDDRSIAWINLPGQLAYRGRRTRLDEFHLALAYCKSEGYDTAILWSDPRPPADEHDDEDRVSAAQFEDVMAAIERIDTPSPAVERFGPKPNESWPDFLARSAKESDAALAKGRGAWVHVSSHVVCCCSGVPKIPPHAPVCPDGGTCDEYACASSYSVTFNMTGSTTAGADSFDWEIDAEIVIVAATGSFIEPCQFDNDSFGPGMQIEVTNATNTLWNGVWTPATGISSLTSADYYCASAGTPSRPDMIYPPTDAVYGPRIGLRRPAGAGTIGVEANLLFAGVYRGCPADSDSWIVDFLNRPQNGVTEVGGSGGAVNSVVLNSFSIS